ncbi:DUF1799 domain-containing protein [Comamonas odontotermitis]|uniref:DUF1799 domain-containing protein n=1 Tax=Comamonas odontotermitis TaxID=379895 RepID=UPI001CC39FAF|nr:DUF1799 domain-containing protein [Comamonas odontotermitis]UBB19546.1 DUF1799 domain-containing protein [Comamonas odontotermitis]
MGIREEPADAWLPDEDVLACMHAFGAPEKDINAVRARIEAQREAMRGELNGADFPVWAENWDVVMAFQDVQTQWVRSSFSGQRMGLNYAGVNAWLDRFIRRTRRKNMFAGLQLMERAVLVADQELADKERR